MRTFAIAAVLLLVPMTGMAQGKNCDELKDEIAKKIEAKGVKQYTLNVVAKEADEGGARMVGTCEGGSKKILYTRGASDDSAKPEGK
jgi:hypothetical protein